MKFYVALSLSLLIASIAFAGKTSQTATKTQDPKIKVTTYSEDYPKEQLKGTQYEHQNFDKKDPQGILSPEERDSLFLKAGIDKEIDSWDQLDKDMLLMKARTAGLAELKEKYPKLPKKALANLIKLLKERR